MWASSAGYDLPTGARVKHIDDCSDERNNAWCVHCGASLDLQPTNRDHVPSRVLLNPAFPPELPVVEVCRACNESFSQDEEYVAAFLGVVLAGTTNPERQKLPAAERILRHSPGIGARILASRAERDGRLVWRPEEDRVRRVLVKNARGHAYYELGLPMLDEPSAVEIVPLEVMSADALDAFESVTDGLTGPWPEDGSRMLERVVVGHDIMGGWVVVQPGTYRYVAEQAGEGVLVRIVMHEYLAASIQWSTEHG